MKANARAVYTEYALAKATNDETYTLPDECSDTTSLDDFSCTYDSGTYSASDWQ